MAVDTMRVRLHLRLIRVLTVLVDTVDRLEVEVTSTRSWSRCPLCGFKCRTVHDRRRRKIRDLPVSGRTRNVDCLVHVVGPGIARKHDRRSNLINRACA